LFIWSETCLLLERSLNLLDKELQKEGFPWPWCTTTDATL